MTNQDKLKILAPYMRNVIPYTKRVDFCAAYLKDKKVLDIGFIDHDLAKARAKDNFIHDDIKKLAGSVLGLDNDQTQIELARQRGYGAIAGDIEDEVAMGALAVSQGPFDVVFAGELIEHLLNIRSFFRSCNLLLKPGGVLIITTPNALGFPFSMGVLKTGSAIGINHTHTVWFDPFTLLTSIESEGRRLKNFAWYVDERYQQTNRSLLSRLYFRVYIYLLRWRPYFAEGFVMVLEKTS